MNHFCLALRFRNARLSDGAASSDPVTLYEDRAKIDLANFIKTLGRYYLCKKHLPELIEKPNVSTQITNN